MNNLNVFRPGYKFGFPFIDHPALEVHNNEVKLYKYVFPPDISPGTLAVIGCIQPLGAIMPISEMQCRWATKVFKVYLHDSIIMAPKGGHIVISVSVRSSVRPSVRHRLFLLTGSSLCSLLLRNYSTDFSNDDTNQLREQCRCATCTSF